MTEKENMQIKDNTLNQINGGMNRSQVDQVVDMSIDVLREMKNLGVIKKRTDNSIK